MPLFWFLAGVLSTLAVLIVVLPYLRSAPLLGRLPSLPWRVGVAAALILAGVLGVYHGLGRPGEPAPPTMEARLPQFRMPVAPGPARAGSMGSAIASLQERLAKGTGSPEDWELLAKSYEFLGLPADAAEARAHRLPPVPADSNDASTTASPESTAPPAGATVHGEVSLTEALRARAKAGTVLFIVAKSVASPGPPVAVLRRSVAVWPLDFTLDDTQSMMAGRNLSSAGRIVVEARISQSGQAMPAPGDLVGSSGPVDPADHRPLNIVIDRVVP